MAKTTTCPHVQNVNNPDGQIANATGTGKVTVFTAGANDSVLRALFGAQTDTNAYTLQLYVNITGSGTDRLVSTMTLAASAGNTATAPPLDILHNSQSFINGYLALDPYGNRVWYLKAGTTVKVALTGTITTAKTLDITGDGGDF